METLSPVFDIGEDQFLEAHATHSDQAIHILPRRLIREVGLRLHKFDPRRDAKRRPREVKAELISRRKRRIVKSSNQDL